MVERMTTTMLRLHSPRAQGEWPIYPESAVADRSLVTTMEPGHHYCMEPSHHYGA
jgi:hypothetical protein